MKEHKNQFLVKELANHCDASADAVRYYTRLGLLKPVSDPVNNYNQYNHEDIRKLKFISKAKHLGYSLSDIAKIFNDCKKDKSPCPRVRKIIEQRIPENRKRLEHMLVLQQCMENALLKWDRLPDGIPDGDTICALIESIDEN